MTANGTPRQEGINGCCGLAILWGPVLKPDSGIFLPTAPYSVRSGNYRLRKELAQQHRLCQPMWQNISCLYMHTVSNGSG